MEAAVREVCPAGAGFTEEMLLLPEKLLKAKREGESALPSRFSCLWVPWQNLPEAHEQHCAHAQLLSRVRLSVTPWAGAHRAPLSIGFPRQESWSGLPFPPPGDLPDLGIKPASPGSSHKSI